MSLRWNGNKSAQEQCDAAYSKLRPKKRKKSSKVKKKHKQQQNTNVSYKEYLVSNWWKSKRKQKLRSVNSLCERCGDKAQAVHHKHYQSLWKEKNSDLEAICNDCHTKEHECIIQADRHLRSIQNEDLNH